VGGVDTEKWLWRKNAGRQKAHGGPKKKIGSVDTWCRSKAKGGTERTMITSASKEKNNRGKTNNSGGSRNRAKKRKARPPGTKDLETHERVEGNKEFKDQTRE